MDQDDSFDYPVEAHIAACRPSVGRPTFPAPPELLPFTGAGFGAYAFALDPSLELISVSHTFPI